MAVYLLSNIKRFSDGTTQYPDNCVCGWQLNHKGKTYLQQKRSLNQPIGRREMYGEETLNRRQA